MDTTTVISIISLAVVTMGGQFAMWRWLVGKMREDRAASETRDSELHERINAVKDNYVRQDHLMQHINRIEAGQGQIQTQLQSGLERINGRIDSLLGTNKDKAG